MESSISRSERRRKIHRRVRKKIFGTGERPRLAVFRSLKHIYVQAIDDNSRNTVAAASTKDKAFSDKVKTGGNMESAKVVGGMIADRLKKMGIDKAVFDRGGYLYHGRIRALAEAAREKGLKF